ncbi:MAG: hypothetical protein EKK48_08130 [Candidatus Melainabacteria bacterium]|nr:MAG: hypothetical protein EKK48_08130 [Candidatus Melainabacteria bacterium]
MKNISIAVAALSTVLSAQPSFAGHKNLLHVHAPFRDGHYELGDLFTNCCDGNEASAQILNVTGKGFGAQLQVTQPFCCDSTYALAGIRGVDCTRLKKTIQFTVTGLGTDPAPVANFGVDVFWTDGQTEHFSFCTVANGGLFRQGNQFLLVTGGSSGVPAGATLTEIDFELDGNCVTGKQTAFVQNVFIDKVPVNYQLDAASAFCGGCG